MRIDSIFSRFFWREPNRMIIETEVQTLPKEMNHFFLKDEKKIIKGYR